MQTQVKPTETLSVAEVHKADAQARLEYHQERQARAQRYRKEYKYLGDDETVLAMHFLAVAFAAEPTLAKWAATKTWNGRKPGPAKMKELLVCWLANPCCWLSRRRVYEAWGV